MALIPHLGGDVFKRAVITALAPPPSSTTQLTRGEAIVVPNLALPRVLEETLSVTQVDEHLCGTTLPPFTLCVAPCLYPLVWYPGALHHLYADLG